MFEKWFAKSEGERVITDTKGKPFTYDNFHKHQWKPLMSEWGLSHLPHDTRHTTISLLATANANPTIIKRIVGHSGAMNLTEKVYTHFEIQPLLDAIDRI
jgi:integrase